MGRSTRVFDLRSISECFLFATWINKVPFRSLLVIFGSPARPLMPFAIANGLSFPRGLFGSAASIVNQEGQKSEVLLQIVSGSRSVSVVFFGGVFFVFIFVSKSKSKTVAMSVSLSFLGSFLFLSIVLMVFISFFSYPPAIESNKGLQLTSLG